MNKFNSVSIKKQVAQIADQSTDGDRDKTSAATVDEERKVKRRSDENVRQWVSGAG